MYAEFFVEHDDLGAAALKARLSAKFAPENRAAVAESPLFAGGRWDDLILFATMTPSYRLFCVAETQDRLQMVVEPVEGNLVRASEAVWSSAYDALVRLSPRLTSLRLVDNESGREILAGAATTWGDELRRRETSGPVVLAAGTVVYSIIGGLTFASDAPGPFLAGTVPGVLAAVVALVFAAASVRKGRITWR